MIKKIEIGTKVELEKLKFVKRRLQFQLTNEHLSVSREGRIFFSVYYILLVGIFLLQSKENRFINQPSLRKGRETATEGIRFRQRLVAFTWTLLLFTIAERKDVGKSRFFMRYLILHFAQSSIKRLVDSLCSSRYEGLLSHRLQCWFFFTFCLLLYFFSRFVLFPSF